MYNPNVKEDVKQKIMNIMQRKKEIVCTLGNLKG